MALKSGSLDTYSCELVSEVLRGAPTCLVGKQPKPSWLLRPASGGT